MCQCQRRFGQMGFRQTGRERRASPSRRSRYFGVTFKTATP